MWPIGSCGWRTGLCCLLLSRVTRIAKDLHRMAKRRNLKKEKQERNRAYARKFKKRKMRNDGRGEGAGNGVTGTANNGGAAD